MKNDAVYGIVLKEKLFTDGLSRDDIFELLNMTGEKEVYPVEFEAREHECSAMGFITVETAHTFDYDYEASGLHDFISSILDNVDMESENGVYQFVGVNISIQR